MPWLPELFTAPVLAQIQEQRRREHLTSVPFFAGLLAGEIEALVGSFAGEPELHHPVRGRIRGSPPSSDTSATCGSGSPSATPRSRTSI
jgi:hypothetical protein